MLYVGAFVLTWSWATVFHLVAWTTGVSVPWISLLINTFNPLQGFWNAFIYARPRYIRLKKQHQHLGFREIIRMVFYPPKDEEERATGTTGGNNVSTLRSMYCRSRSFLASVKKYMGASSSSLKESQASPTKTSARPVLEAVDEEEGGSSDGGDSGGKEAEMNDDKAESGGGDNKEDGWSENTPSPTTLAEKVVQ